jgi:hypothetical protein
VGAWAFMRVAKKRMMFAIYAMPITESVKGPETLSTRYKEYQDVFEKKNVDMLLQHHPYDCAINLQEDTQLPFGPIYNLSQNKLTVLREYLNENLAKNFIELTKSLAGVHILFIKKKDGLLRMCVG